VPAQEPPQRRNDDPFLDLGVSTTLVPAANEALHFPGHEIPAGALVMLPPPSTTVARVGRSGVAALAVGSATAARASVQIQSLAAVMTRTRC
jgi:hypothetical protein